MIDKSRTICCDIIIEHVKYYTYPLMYFKVGTHTINGKCLGLENSIDDFPRYY